jgi:type VI secretion system protein ImpA
MSEELQKPPVVDLDLIFQPIAGENPSGQDLRYSGLYDEIREARRADDDLVQGEWQTELKVADFPKALNLSVDALSNKSKDIQIAAWLSEALVMMHGFAGLRDGLKILGGLQEKFWDTLYPEVDDGDMESRANAIAWMDTQVGLALRKAPYTGAAGYSFSDWQDSKTFDFPDNIDGLDGPEKERITKLKQQAEKQRRVTADLWKKEIAATRRAAVEAANFTIDECWQALGELNRVIEEKFDRNQAPGLTSFKKSLDEVHSQVKTLLAQKRLEEPDEVAVEEVDGAEDGAGGTVSGNGKAGPAGAIQNRRDALKRLGEIADFFKRSEPHSPVSYIVQKAVKWGEMPLESWLQEVIKDQSVLGQLKETLGVTGDASSGT